MDKTMNCRLKSCKQSEQPVACDYDLESGNDCFGIGYNCCYAGLQGRNHLVASQPSDQGQGEARVWIVFTRSCR